MALVSPDLDAKNPATRQHNGKVAILDCGAQYTKVIDRRVRALNLESDIFPLSVSSDEVASYGAIILSGGPNSVHAESALKYDTRLLDLPIPILGICYGMQLMAQHFGGVVEPGKQQEYGETEITVETTHPVFAGLSAQQHVLMSHGDHVAQLPPGFSAIGHSEDKLLAAMAHESRPLVGFQFHPEVELSQHGVVMLKNFLLNVAQLTPAFTLEDRLEQAITDIRQRVGSRNVLTLVSGGVDSAVTTALLLKALPVEQVYALHIDTGMMRQNESDLVCKALEAIGLKHLVYLKAEADFLNATTDWDGVNIGPLCKVSNPEHKRRIIGDTFLKLTQREIQKLNLNLDETFIAQGTLRPDLIESGNADVSQTAHTIKTHHNDVPMIQEQRKKGLIIEPNRDWHKDEVREIGRLCGLPAELVERQPFPGPGLGIRVLCTDTPVSSPDDATATQTLQTMADKLKLQATLLPFHSVGVQGDARSYRRTVALSQFQPQSDADIDKLYDLARQLTNRCHAVNRVILNLRAEPLPQTQTTITPTFLTHDTLEVLRGVDALVLSTLQADGYLSKLSQTFSVLLPFDASDNSDVIPAKAGIQASGEDNTWIAASAAMTSDSNGCQRSIVIRAVVTSDFMTARAARLGLTDKAELPYVLLAKLAEAICSRFPIRDVFYDLTSKPPGTVEWE